MPPRAAVPTANAATPVPGGALVTATDVTRIYRRGGEQIVALSGANLQLDRGTFALVVGPSGGGKSTLLHLLGGIDRYGAIARNPIDGSGELVAPGRCLHARAIGSSVEA